LHHLHLLFAPHHYCIIIRLQTSLTLNSLRNLGLVGHIEDIAVDSNQRKKNLGKIIIETLDYLAKNAGCYKSILDCSEHNVGFYEKCGHKVAGTQMVRYHSAEGRAKL